MTQINKEEENREEEYEDRSRSTIDVLCWEEDEDDVCACLSLRDSIEMFFVLFCDEFLHFCLLGFNCIYI